jgi:hypothetical protein
MNNPSGQFGQAANSNTAAQNRISGQLSPLIGSYTGGINLPGINTQLLSYLLNPQSTNLSQVFGPTSAFYNQELSQGLSPQSLGAATNQYQVGQQQQINSLMNQFGSGLPNPSGTLEDLNMQSTQGRAALGSQLAGMNQEVQSAGATGLTSLAGGLDAQKLAMLTGAGQYGQQATQLAVNPLMSEFGTYGQQALDYNQMGLQADQMQANMWSGILNGLMGVGMMGATGGLSGLFGAGAGPGIGALGGLFGGGTSGFLDAMDPMYGLP